MAWLTRKWFVHRPSLVYAALGSLLFSTSCWSEDYIVTLRNPILVPRLRVQATPAFTPWPLRTEKDAETSLRAGIGWIHQRTPQRTSCKEVSLLAYVDVADQRFEAGRAQLEYCAGAQVAEITYLEVNQDFADSSAAVAGALAYAAILEADRQSIAKVGIHVVETGLSSVVAGLRSSLINPYANAQMGFVGDSYDLFRSDGDRKPAERVLSFQLSQLEKRRFDLAVDGVPTTGSALMAPLSIFQKPPKQANVNRLFAQNRSGLTLLSFLKGKLLGGSVLKFRHRGNATLARVTEFWLASQILPSVVNGEEAELLHELLPSEVAYSGDGKTEAKIPVRIMALHDARCDKIIELLGWELMREKTYRGKTFLDFESAN